MRGVDPTLGPEPHVVIEMGGPNIVIRSTTAIDHADTTALAHAVNAAADTRTVVVLDPESVRCDDAFAAHVLPATDTTCSRHDTCRPAPVEAISRGVIRIAAERTSWTIDVDAGRFCQTDFPIDTKFLDPESWTPVIAICITPTKLTALTVDRTLITSDRAHRPERLRVAAAG
jgi:hypothetical protein